MFFVILLTVARLEADCQELVWIGIVLRLEECLSHGCWLSALVVGVLGFLSGELYLAFSAEIDKRLGKVIPHRYEERIILYHVLTDAEFGLDGHISQVAHFGDSLCSIESEHVDVVFSGHHNEINLP